MSQRAAWKSSIVTIACRSEGCTHWPLPERSRSSRATRMPWARKRAAAVLESGVHGAFVAVRVEEVEADRRGVAFDDVAGLHLDDAGAHVGELAHGGRARARAREIDHRDVLEGKDHQRVPAGRMAEPVWEAGVRRIHLPAAAAVRESR